MVSAASPLCEEISSYFSPFSKAFINLSVTEAEVTPPVEQTIKPVHYGECAVRQPIIFAAAR